MFCYSVSMVVRVHPDDGPNCAQLALNKYACAVHIVSFKLVFGTFGVRHARPSLPGA